MGIESAARAWAHQHDLQQSRWVVSAYRGLSNLRYRSKWDTEVAFRGHLFEIGRDLTLFPAVRSGGFESAEIDVLIPMVPADAEVWDVGANIGLYTVLLASAAHRGHVVAFEPVPDTHTRLLGNVARNNLTNVSVQQVALSSSRGTVRMLVHPEAHGCDHIGEVPLGADAVEVSTVTGMEFLETHGLRDPDVIKVDIEGHEPDFLAGVWPMIERRRPTLMLEVNPTAWDSAVQVDTWQTTLGKLFELYGAGQWFDAGVQSRVEAIDTATLNERAYTLLFAGAGR